eukprot:5223238-Alexandrium_andersonii.AAC.1
MVRNHDRTSSGAPGGKAGFFCSVATPLMASGAVQPLKNVTGIMNFPLATPALPAIAAGVEPLLELGVDTDQSERAADATAATSATLDAVEMDVEVEVVDGGASQPGQPPWRQHLNFDALMASSSSLLFYRVVNQRIGAHK